jgi:hypothetical protein
MSESNEYMEQVMANQQKLAVDLRAKRQLAPARRGAAAAPANRAHLEAALAAKEKLPKPAELRAITIGGGGAGGDGGGQSLAALVAQMAAILESFRALPPAAAPRRP